MNDPDMNGKTDRSVIIRLQELIDQHDLWNLDNRLERAMDALRCPESDAPINILSGGERRRVALCRLLLQTRYLF